MRLVLTMLFMLLSMVAWAEKPVYEVVIEQHMFHPDRLVIPANTKVRLVLHNRDDAPEEFESYQLNREKVIPANSSSSILVGPLTAGEYRFFGEFNLSTAQGVIVVE